MDCHFNDTVGFFQFLSQGGDSRLAIEARQVVGVLLGTGIVLLVALIGCSISIAYCCYLYCKHKRSQNNHSKGWYSLCSRSSVHAKH